MEKNFLWGARWSKAGFLSNDQYNIYQKLWVGDAKNGGVVTPTEGLLEAKGSGTSCIKWKNR